MGYDNVQLCHSEPHRHFAGFRDVWQKSQFSGLPITQGRSAPQAGVLSQRNR
jgi:hypothetical protein